MCLWHTYIIITKCVHVHMYTCSTLGVVICVCACVISSLRMGVVSTIRRYCGTIVYVCNQQKYVESSAYGSPSPKPKLCTPSDSHLDWPLLLLLLCQKKVVCTKMSCLCFLCCPEVYTLTLRVCPDL